MGKNPLSTSLFFPVRASLLLKTDLLDAFFSVALLAFRLAG
jgi:hypothetical protein